MPLQGCAYQCLALQRLCDALFCHTFAKYCESFRSHAPAVLCNSVPYFAFAAPINVFPWLAMPLRCYAVLFHASAVLCCSELCPCFSSPFSAQQSRSYSTPCRCKAMLYDSSPFLGRATRGLSLPCPGLAASFGSRQSRCCAYLRLAVQCRRHAGQSRPNRAVPLLCCARGCLALPCFSVAIRYVSALCRCVALRIATQPLIATPRLRHSTRCHAIAVQRSPSPSHAIAVRFPAMPCCARAPCC